MAIPLIVAAVARVAGGMVAKTAAQGAARAAGSGAAKSATGSTSSTMGKIGRQLATSTMNGSRNEPRNENFSMGALTPAGGAASLQPPQWAP